MKFTPKESFKHGHQVFEAGNTYDSSLYGLSDDDVKGFHRAGWSEVEGMDPAPARQTNPVTINPKKAAHKTTAATAEVKKHG